MILKIMMDLTTYIEIKIMEGSSLEQYYFLIIVMII